MKYSLESQYMYVLYGEPGKALYEKIEKSPTPHTHSSELK